MPDSYPSVRIIEGYRQTPRDGRMVDAGGDGLARARILHNDRWEFSVPHGILTAADLSTLRTFYTNHRTVEFYFTSPQDGVQYTVIFGGRPDEQMSGAGIAVTSRLMQSSA